jgi:hypothetical protein
MNTQLNTLVNELMDSEPLSESKSPPEATEGSASQDKSAGNDIRGAGMDPEILRFQYPFLHARSDRRGQSVEENEDLSVGYVFMNMPEKGPTRFYYWADITTAQLYIKNLPEPHFSSYLLRDRPIRAHVELDIEKDKMDAILLKRRHQQKLKTLMKMKGCDESTAMTYWIIEEVKEAMVDACEQYGLEDDDRVRFLEAHDFKRDDGKKSVRLYTRHYLPNYAHYKNWRRMVKDSLSESVNPMLDEHCTALRMPNNYKGNHVMEWVSQDARFGDGVLNYVEGCTLLAGWEDVEIETP